MIGFVYKNYTVSGIALFFGFREYKNRIRAKKMVTQIPVKLTKRMLKIQKKNGKPITEVMAEALEKSGYRVPEAAEAIGIDITTFYAWMNRLGIRKDWQFPNNNGERAGCVGNQR